MSIEQIEVQRFRNLSSVHINPDPRLNIIFGDNGSGKTSLVEVLYTLARLKSFRTTDPRQLIQMNQSDCLCVAKIREDNDRLHHLGIQRSREQWKVKLNGQGLRRSSELAQLLPLQIINNDVHLLIEGGPNQRRQFLDWGVFHEQGNYGETLKQFRHCLKQRNAALKQHLSAKQIQLWDSPLLESATQITQMRNRYFHDFQTTLEKLLGDSFNLPTFTLQFYQGWDKQQDFASALNQSFESDLRSGNTQPGPHRADIRLRSNSTALKEVVSRGQQKILATLMMLAQIELFRQKQGRKLILLIDDLPAELDKYFSQYFLKKVLATDSQIFITTPNRESLVLPQHTHLGKWFHVEHGKILEVDSL